MKTIVTHGANFHSDDLFAVALLVYVLQNEGYSISSKKIDKKIKIIRTMDPKIIETGDYVVDIGAIYNSKKQKFDHHQLKGAGTRRNGVPYASFGLVWKEYGKKLTGSVYASDWVDRQIVQAIDAMDSGMYLYKPIIGDVHPFLFQDYFSIACDVIKSNSSDISVNTSTTSTAKILKNQSRFFDKEFVRLMHVAYDVISMYITKAKQKEHIYALSKKVYTSAKDKRIVISDIFIPTRFEEFTAPPYVEPLVFVYPDLRGGWSAKVVPKESQSYEARMLFPVEWRGRSGIELEQVTGVKDAQFCHNAGFLLVAKTKESILEMLSLIIEKK